MHRDIRTSGKQGMNVQLNDSDEMALAVTGRIQMDAKMKITGCYLAAQFESVCTTTNYPTAKEIHET